MVVVLALVAIGSYAVVSRSGTAAGMDPGPFSMGVIYGTKDAYANNPANSSGPAAPYRNPAALEAYYQPWFDGQGTSTRSNMEVTNTRVGINVGNVSACTSQMDRDPQSCFQSEHLGVWSPGGKDGWHGELNLQVPMILASSVPAPYTTAVALQGIKRNLDFGAYGSGTANAPAAFPYAANYRNLATTLVGYHLSRSDITIAPESQGRWYPSQFGPDPAAWARYFDNIRAAMMSVPGAEFRFVWAMGLYVSTTGTDGSTVSMQAAYPGDAAVDVVGVDWTDQNFGSVQIGRRVTPEPYPQGDCSGLLPAACPLKESAWARAWTKWYLPATNTALSVYGLQWWADFAEQHHKQFALAAWGLSGAGDNGYLIHQVWQWLNGLPHGLVAFETYQTDGVDSYWTDAHGSFNDSVLWPAQAGVTDGTVYRQGPCVYLKWFGGQTQLRCGQASTKHGTKGSKAHRAKGVT